MSESIPHITDTIARELMALETIGREPAFGIRFWLGGASRHERFMAQRDRLRAIMQHGIITKPSDLMPLFKQNFPLSSAQKGKLLTLAGHGGSVAKRDNEILAPLFHVLRQTADLDSNISRTLDWMWKTHGY